MTEKIDSIANFKVKHPIEWKKIKHLFNKILIRKYLLIASIALGVLAVVLYFYIGNNPWEISIIPLMLAATLLYYLFFQISKKQELELELASVFIPAFIHQNNWNIEYEVNKKPYIREFQGSRLYPYTLTQIEGHHFFTGIAKKLPFIAWFVDASFRAFVGESALSQISTTSEINGFLGFQIIVKNLNPNLFGFIAIPKSLEFQEITAVYNYYVRDPKWKQLECDDKDVRKSYSVFTPKANPNNKLNQSIINKLIRIKAQSKNPVAISFKKQATYLMQYWQNDVFLVDANKSLNNNLKEWEGEIQNLVNISYTAALPI